jgi:hypothetical protein
MDVRAAVLRGEKGPKKRGEKTRGKGQERRAKERHGLSRSNSVLNTMLRCWHTVPHSFRVAPFRAE